MAFGFFKKKESADIIYTNGHIYTQDPEFPWASAVACKGNKIMAVGDFDGMDEIVDDDTEIVDLKGRYMFPGFIEVHGTPVLKAFEDHYLKIDSAWDIEPVLDSLSDYVDGSDREVIFGYGFHERILEGFENPEDAHAILDEIERDKPVILLGISGVHCWVNTLAAEIIHQAAEDDVVEYLTTSYIMNILSPLSLDDVAASIKEFSEEMADKGITSLFNLCAPDYFTELYLDNQLAAIGEGDDEIKQRFHGSTYITRPFQSRLILHRLVSAKTNCIELDHLITADFMKLEVNEDESLAGFSQEALNTICLDVAEKGFNIHLDAKDAISYEKALEAFALLREKGYRNNTLVLASAYSSNEDDGDFTSTWSTDHLNESVFSHVGSVLQAIDALTIDAAELLGKSAELGSIEKGKLADFTVFEENPFDGDLKRFSLMHADMTIVDGLIVYDAEDAAADEMCDILFSMQL